MEVEALQKEVERLNAKVEEEERRERRRAMKMEEMERTIRTYEAANSEDERKEEPEKKKEAPRLPEADDEAEFESFSRFISHKPRSKNVTVSKLKQRKSIQGDMLRAVKPGAAVSDDSLAPVTAIGKRRLAGRLEKVEKGVAWEYMGLDENGKEAFYVAKPMDHEKNKREVQVSNVQRQERRERTQVGKPVVLCRLTRGIDSRGTFRTPEAATERRCTRLGDGP